jgi:hypothetical protein
MFKVFSFGCHGNQSSAWNGILGTTLLRLHTRNIPVMFHYDLPHGFRGDVV